jgi:hypothetical protein
MIRTGLQLAPARAEEPLVRPIHVTVTWESEHVVEVDDDADLADLLQVLAGQSNVRLVGYAAQPLDEAVDAAVDQFLGDA